MTIDDQLPMRGMSLRCLGLRCLGLRGQVARDVAARPFLDVKRRSLLSPRHTHPRFVPLFFAGPARPIFARSLLLDETWVMLMEKAYAKVECVGHKVLQWIWSKRGGGLTRWQQSGP